VIAELVDVESRGLYRMALLDRSVAFRDDRAWLERHIAMQKLRLAAHIAAGWHAAIDADGAIAYFECRWRVRVDVDLSRVDVADAEPQPVAVRRPELSKQVRRRMVVDRDIKRLAAYRPPKPGIFSTPMRATPNSDEGTIPDARRNTLYINDDLVAVGLKPFTADTARHLLRHPDDPVREVVLDRLAPRKRTDRLLAQMLRRSCQRRAPRIHIGDQDKDLTIVSECVNASKPSFPRIMLQLNPDLANRIGYIDGSRRPPRKPPPGIRPSRWKTDMDLWIELRRELAQRWETLRSWVLPDPETTPMKEWKPVRQAESAPFDGVLKYVDKQTEPQVVEALHTRHLMPGESFEYPIAHVRRIVKTTQRR
jgi:hypothetical protein